MNDDQLIRSAYYGRRDDNPASAYNFDLTEMIGNFSFYDFCDDQKKRNIDSAGENGAFLAITDKQYILSYNASYGMGTHLATAARIYKDLHGGGRIENSIMAVKLSGLCNREFLCARIVYEGYYNEDTRSSHYSGYISFNLAADNKKNKEITPGMLENFEQFYRDYYDEIKYVCKKFNFVVTFNYFNQRGELVRDDSSDLDNLYAYLKTKVNVDIPLNDDEKIIGVTPNNKNIK